METVTKNNSFYRQIFKLVLGLVFRNLLGLAVRAADVVLLSFVALCSLFLWLLLCQ